MDAVLNQNTQAEALELAKIAKRLSVNDQRQIEAIIHGVMIGLSLNHQDDSKSLKN